MPFALLLPIFLFAGARLLAQRHGTGAATALAATVPAWLWLLRQL